MIAWKMLFEYLPKELIAKTNETELSVNLINGSEICLKGADNPDSLRGVGLQFVVIDEFASMKQEVWFEIVRPMLTDTKGKALFIGTPKGKNALWELFIKGQKEEDGFKAWRFKTIDNSWIDPYEVEQAKQQLNERYFKQEFEASFEDYVGLIWPEFSHKEHIIEPYALPGFYNRLIAIDPALTGTSAIIFCAVDRDENLIIYDEYYEKNKRVSEVAEIISSSGVSLSIIDPAAKKNHILREGKLYSLLDEFSEYGVYPTLGENNVDAGINRVAEFFKQGKIKIFNTCKHLIWELERYHWSEERETVSGILKPKPYKADDHLCDCLRYLVMFRVNGSVENTEPPITEHSLARVLRESEHRHKDWKNNFS